MDLKSNEPFWLIKNGLPASYPSLHQDAECDVLIVGGGITGSLIAHQCIQDGYTTLLIDRREICNGSSSATTSMLQYEIDIPLHQLIELIGKKGALAAYKACSEAIDQLDKITRMLKSESGFARKQSLYYVARKKDLEWMKKEFEVRKEAGYDVKWLEADQLKDTYEIHKTYGGILSEQGGSMDAFRFAHELLIHNEKKGLRIYDKTELTNVEAKRGFNSCITSTGAVIQAKKVIYCTGYESAAIIPEQFVNLLSSYAVVSEVDEQYNNYKDLLIWNTEEPYLYMRTTDDGRFLIGGKDVTFQDSKKRDAFIGRKEQQLVKSFKQLFPGNTFYADFSWAGTFGETKDGLPYIGTHTAFKNAYFVLGFGGNGITFSVAGMEMVSAWLKGKKHPLTPYFSFGR